MAALLALLAAISATGCGGQPDDSPAAVAAANAASRWALRATDIGGGSPINVGIGHFGEGSCNTGFFQLVGDQLSADAPNDGATYSIAGYEVRSQVLQLFGNTENAEYAGYTPTQVIGSLSHNIRLNVDRFSKGGMSPQVTLVEGLGDDGQESFDWTGTATVGCRVRLVPPWDGLAQELGTRELQGDATEWYQEAWFRLVDGMTMVVVAIQGPRPVGERFDTWTLLDVMTERVRADRPSRVWGKSEQ